jgi:hypothetical protein
MLETVIPKEANSLVMVVNGKHRGKVISLVVLFIANMPLFPQHKFDFY